MLLTKLLNANILFIFLRQHIQSYTFGRLGIDVTFYAKCRYTRSDGYDFRLRISIVADKAGHHALIIVHIIATIHSSHIVAALANTEYVAIGFGSAATGLLSGYVSGTLQAQLSWQLEIVVRLLVGAHAPQAVRKRVQPVHLAFEPIVDGAIAHRRKAQPDEYVEREEPH